LTPRAYHSGQYPTTNHTSSIIFPVGLKSIATHRLRGFIPKFPDHAHHKPLFDTLTATASNLQKELASSKIKIAQIVEEYHRFAYNGSLNAVWELAPGATKRAEEIDLLTGKG